MQHSNLKKLYHILPKSFWGKIIISAIIIRMITKNKFALQVSHSFTLKPNFLKFTKLVNPPNLRLPNSLSSIFYSFVIISSKSPIPKLFQNIPLN